MIWEEIFSEFIDPFFFLPLVAEALKDSEVSCRFCCVRMISPAGLVRELCPECFEERCVKCGTEVAIELGRVIPGERHWDPRSVDD